MHTFFPRRRHVVPGVKTRRSRLRPVFPASSSLSSFGDNETCDWDFDKDDGDDDEELYGISVFEECVGNVETVPSSIASVVHNPMLLAACKRGEDIDRIKDLAKRGAEINVVDRDGNTPLHLASKMGNVEIVKCLLELGADADAKNKRKLTPLDIAQGGAHLAFLEDGMDAMLELAVSGDVGGAMEEMRRILQHGCVERDVQTRVLKAAAGCAAYDLVVHLMDERYLPADASSDSADRSTALFYAVQADDMTMVRLLLERGADPQRQDISGRTPMDYAQSRIARRVLSAAILARNDGMSRNNAACIVHDTFGASQKLVEGFKLVEFSKDDVASVEYAFPPPDGDADAQTVDVLTRELVVGKSGLMDEDRSSPRFLSFVTTDAQGKRSYSFVLAFASENDSFDSSVVQALCIASHWPLISFFRTVLVELWKLRGEDASVIGDALVTLVAHEDKDVGIGDSAKKSKPQNHFWGTLPGYGSALRVRIGTASMLYASPAKRHLPIVDDECFAVLRSCLSSENIAKIVGAMLLEQSCLIVSSRICMLTPACEALIALLFPFHWTHIYTPVLPLSLIAVAEAPVPFLIGVSTDGIELLDPSVMPSITLVNLDRNSVVEPIEPRLASQMMHSNDTTARAAPTMPPEMMRSVCAACTQQLDPLAARCSFFEQDTEKNPGRSSVIIGNQAWRCPNDSGPACNFRCRWLTEIIKTLGVFLVKVAPIRRDDASVQRVVRGFRSSVSVQMFLYQLTKTQLFEIFIDEFIDSGRSNRGEQDVFRMEVSERGTGEIFRFLLDGHMKLRHVRILRDCFVRAQPLIDSRIVENLKPGDFVEVLQEVGGSNSFSTSWIQVRRCDGRSHKVAIGWLRGVFGKDFADDEDSATSATNDRGFSGAQGLHFGNDFLYRWRGRSGESTSSRFPVPVVKPLHASALHEQQCVELKMFEEKMDIGVEAARDSIIAVPTPTPFDVKSPSEAATPAVLPTPAAQPAAAAYNAELDPSFTLEDPPQNAAELQEKKALILQLPALRML